MDGLFPTCSFVVVLGLVGGSSAIYFSAFISLALFFCIAPGLEWGVMKEVAPFLIFTSLHVFEFIIPHALGD